MDTLLAHSVYVLWSARSHRFYIGVSRDPAARLKQHNAASNANWTARHRPWRMVWTQSLPTREQALALERRLKAQHGSNGFFALTGLDPAAFR